MPEQGLDAAAHTSDRDLLRAVAGSDQAALRQLYALHGPYILAYLVGQLEDRTLAEEVLQDVMLAVWNGAARFRGASKVRTWMLAIARNQAISARRKRRATLVELDDSLPASDDTAFQVLEQRTEMADMRSALQHLPAEQRETLELVFYHGLSGKETASLLGVAYGTVKSRLHRARMALRGLIHPEDVNA
jgi:RNA polymerase sigma-70 factor, ECF subfamily